MARRRKTQPKNSLNRVVFAQCILPLKEKQGFRPKGHLTLDFLKE